MISGIMYVIMTFIFDLIETESLRHECSFRKLDNVSFQISHSLLVINPSHLLSL